VAVIPINDLQSRLAVLESLVAHLMNRLEAVDGFNGCAISYKQIGDNIIFESFPETEKWATNKLRH
jgi:hypothetical protein